MLQLDPIVYAKGVQIDNNSQVLVGSVIWSLKKHALNYLLPQDDCMRSRGVLRMSAAYDTVG